MLKFLLVIAVFALATYLTIRVIQRRGLLEQGPQRPSARPSRPAPKGPKPKPRIVAPDDDEDFLRDLDRKRLHPDDPDNPPATT
ncbi:MULTISPECIES: hypothetical protein [Nocardioides]|uniref:hypothetical protein n=1 Tax=Nocardioides TaxID=1839 RepID=UPI00187AFA26|nr:MULTISPECIES: hypothetical protein [Nocardioides]MBJ7528339.1 hypothetical protein [Nocardioides sp.]MCM3514928.1 hypothetical protein [Nocardioides sp. P86]